MTLRQWLLWMCLCQRYAALLYMLILCLTCTHPDFNFRSFEYEQIDIRLIFQVGELIGGSQREERLEVIQRRSENFLCFIFTLQCVNMQELLLFHFIFYFSLVVGFSQIEINFLPTLNL